MKTYLLIEIDHKKPLPNKSPITDMVGQRVYGFLYSQNCEAGVVVKLLDEAMKENADATQ